LNCLNCNLKSCRTAKSCGLESFDRDAIEKKYHQSENQSVVQAAADLVDGGKAGSLSRLQELLEFIPAMGYKKPALAYCYGMEKQAKVMVELFKKHGIQLVGISCTAGAHSQNELNQNSSIAGVSCNPLSQAEQLNRQGADLAILFGLCLGHDILFSRAFLGDVTTFVVKDRFFAHNPMDALKDFA
jgi:uncharacterized metal-binding protein